ncbi:MULTISPECIES: hypothetical protein [Methylobacterium]|uniref:Uncharacterized protein n=3 Tax=Methylobacterium TaxID=407 RepID=A0ABQ4SXK2_9HYPH|nr:MULTISPECIES: hypothetical protein [Methylobacterium]PIU05820.1 MAG: hypothetical protein COT56_12870 [Methylobacterium sp. CG09_land_8_20_14_0_10_71_15]GJE07812.1 hypothetical protein AOPFMNJM_3142 [Methylobacterium jeotgali]
MRSTCLRLLLASAVLGALSGPVAAQSFFEELFGIGRAAKPPVPPRPVPGPAQPQPGALPPGAVPAPGDPNAPLDPNADASRAAPPAPARPVVLKVPGDDNVTGQELLLNGLTGSLKLERAGAAMTARVVLPGSKVSQPTESCKVPLAEGRPVTLTSEGRPDGVARFEAAAAECPLRFEVWEGGVLVTALGGNPVCTFTAADCATTPVGFWGPAAPTLIGRSGEFDAARGVADKAVRDNFKIMTQRARREDVRGIVTEQAAFSSDREQLCRTYAREGAHGFCHLRHTEARALSLAQRLGALGSGAATAAAAPAARVRRPKPAAVDGLNPDAAQGGGIVAE